MMDVPLQVGLTLFGLMIGVAGWGFNYLLEQIKALAKCQNDCQRNLMNRRESDAQNHLMTADKVRERLDRLDIHRAETDKILEQMLKDQGEIIQELKVLSLEVKVLSDCVKLMAKGVKEC